jgi:hypothetical protein
LLWILLFFAAGWDLGSVEPEAFFFLFGKHPWVWEKTKKKKKEQEVGRDLFAKSPWCSVFGFCCYFVLIFILSSSVF